ncbi:hypothetical protein ASE14_06445 [Agromyces sp. Root81]|uniref:hypothetical protein n=1 Tax=Agromyces sp. Root81 TaxID=1736601 RepID=UPI0007012FD9|nr:hypothetical protein [Agromyces sp. Root81]KRC60626.1 hypothetical protein ASE14_06445 [Agromyces sp. Root81]
MTVDDHAFTLIAEAAVHGLDIVGAGGPGVLLDAIDDLGDTARIRLELGHPLLEDDLFIDIHMARFHLRDRFDGVHS